MSKKRKSSPKKSSKGTRKAKQKPPVASVAPGVPLDPFIVKRKPQIAFVIHITHDAKDKMADIKKKEGLASLSDAIMDAVDHYHASLQKNGRKDKNTDM